MKRKYVRFSPRPAARGGSFSACSPPAGLMPVRARAACRCLPTWPAPARSRHLPWLSGAVLERRRHHPADHQHDMVSYSCNITCADRVHGGNRPQRCHKRVRFRLQLRDGQRRQFHLLWAGRVRQQRDIHVGQCCVRGYRGLAEECPVDGANTPTLGMTGGPYTISAQIPASQTTLAGTYDETVTFTMAF